MTINKFILFHENTLTAMCSAAHSLPITSGVARRGRSGHSPTASHLKGPRGRQHFIILGIHIERKGPRRCDFAYGQISSLYATACHKASPILYKDISNNLSTVYFCVIQAYIKSMKQPLVYGSQFLHWHLTIANIKLMYVSKRGRSLCSQICFFGAKQL